MNEELLIQLAGMVTSYLRGGNRPKSTLDEIDGVIHRLELNGATPNQIQLVIQAGRDRLPRRYSKEGIVITEKYLQRHYWILVPGGEAKPAICTEDNIASLLAEMDGHIIGEGATPEEALKDMR